MSKSSRDERCKQAWLGITSEMNDLPDGAFWQAISDMAGVSVEQFQDWCVRNPRLTQATPQERKDDQ